MKKLIFILLLIVPFFLNAQDVEINNGQLGRDNWNAWDMCGASDILTPSSDSLIYFWETLKHEPYTATFGIDADTIAGMDTTLVWEIVGRNRSSQSWTVIANGTIAAFNDTNIDVSSHSSNTYALTQANSTIAQYNSTIASTRDTLFGNAYTDTSAAGTIDTLIYDSLLYVNAAKTITNAAQTITNGTVTLTSTSINYNFIGIRLYLPGDDATGAGYIFDNIYLYLDKRGL